MTQYLELQESDISGILRKYNLKQIDYESIEEGEGNTSYLVSTKQNQYVLTIFEINHTRTEKLSRLLGSLKKHGFPATRVRKLENGEATTSFQGKPVILKPFIVGQVVEKPNENMVWQVGTAMANLHDIKKPDYLPRKHAYGLETFPDVMSTGLNIEYENWLAKRYEILVQTIPSGLPLGLIHGDLFYDNVLFDGEKFKAIIDFEDACVYYKIFDLGMAVVGMCTEKSKIKLSKVRSLVKGYQEIRKLEDNEMETLQMFIAYAATATSSWRFWKYNIDTPIAALTEKHWEMVKISKVVRAIPNEKFVNAVF